MQETTLISKNLLQDGEFIQQAFRDGYLFVRKSFEGAEETLVFMKQNNNVYNDIRYIKTATSIQNLKKYK